MWLEICIFVLMVIGIILIYLGYTRECPPQQIIYRIIKPSLLERQESAVPLDVKFKSYFEDRSLLGL